MLFSFGRDVNIKWKHGVNALPENEQDGKGRISIILWGLAPNVIEEDGSPEMLNDNTRGNGYSMHRNHDNRRGHDNRRDHYHRDRSDRRHYHDDGRRQYRRSRSRDHDRNDHRRRDDHREVRDNGR